MSGLDLLIYFLIWGGAAGIAGIVVNARIITSDNRLIFFGRWGIGGLLFGAILAVVWTVAEVASCAIFTPGDGNKWEPNYSGCTNTDGTVNTRLVSWFAVLTQWQAGVGAGLGLLGLAWAAYFDKSIKSNDQTEKKLDALMKATGAQLDETNGDK